MTSSAEKFEILSAYLDDEASLEERYLVEQWIKRDPLFRQQYQAQLRLKAAIQELKSDCFDCAIASPLQTANTLSHSDHRTHLGTHLEPTLIEREPDKLSIRTAIVVDKSSNLLPVAAYRSDRWLVPRAIKLSGLSDGLDTARGSLTTSCASMALRCKDLFAISAALCCAAFTVFSYSTIKGTSGWGHSRRTSGKITQTDQSLLQRQRLVMFSAQ